MEALWQAQMQVRGAVVATVCRTGLGVFRG